MHHIITEQHFSVAKLYKIYEWSKKKEKNQLFNIDL